MKTLKDLQKEVAVWATHNFGNNREPFLGVVEEVGELAHSILKRKQGIRGSEVEHNADIADAVADIVIYLADFCESEKIDLQTCVESTWNEVKKRDWIKFPKNGVIE